jgi:hypothetical protein
MKAYSFRHVFIHFEFNEREGVCEIEALAAALKSEKPHSFVLMCDTVF